MFILSTKKDKRFDLPPGWPSYWHNKCNNSRCTYANDPQAAAGTFNCRGCSKGTYEISPIRAADYALKADRIFREIDNNRKNLKMLQENSEQIRKQRDYARYEAEKEEQRRRAQIAEAEAKRRKDIEAHQRLAAENYQQKQEALALQRQHQESEKIRFEAERQRTLAKGKGVDARNWGGLNLHEEEIEPERQDEEMIYYSRRAMPCALTRRNARHGREPPRVASPPPPPPPPRPAYLDDPYWSRIPVGPGLVHRVRS